MKSDQVCGVIRHLITAVGGAGAAVADDEILKFVSAMAVVLGFIWSVWSKSRSAQIGGSPLPVLAVLALAGAVGVAGCRTMPDQASVITPKRVEAVSALGSYLAARSQVGRYRPELEAAHAALQTLKASDNYDLVVVAAALRAAGVTYLDTTEGQLFFAGLVTFQDLWNGKSMPILESEYARAVVVGCERGLGLALATTQTRARAPAAGGTEAELYRRAMETR